MDEALLWQDRPQRTVNTAHSTATLTLTKIISTDQRELCEQMNKLHRRALNEKWLDNGPDSKTSKCDNEQTTLSAKRHTAEVMGPPTGKAKRPRPSRAPPVLRIDSASFGLLIKKPPKLSAASFVNRVAETAAYCERRKQMVEVIDKLRALLRV
ncbi:unnamed protein product [Toxocara canis]|nr:unnamed protein product [Toxocara canis]